MPRWSRTDTELYFFNGTRMESVAIRTEPDLGVASRETLFDYPPRVQGSDAVRSYDVAPDGRFLIITNDDAVRPDHLIVVRGWGQEIAAAGVLTGSR